MIDSLNSYRYGAQEASHDSADIDFSIDSELSLIALDIIGDAMICANTRGDVMYMNKAAEIIIGLTRGQAMNRPISEIFTFNYPISCRHQANTYKHHLDNEREADIKMNNNHILIRQDGVEVDIELSSVHIRNQCGIITGTAFVFRDERFSHGTTTKMTHLAQHDCLTGLCNRLALSERLSQALGLARRHGRQVALLFIDLDNFKNINDSLGHEAGDRLLVRLSRHLEECVRVTDTVCRYGGDEFVILLSEIELPADAERVARKIITNLSISTGVNGSASNFSLSIGISVYPGDGVDADTLLRKADAAMYQVKSSGKSTHQFFHNWMATPDDRRARSASFRES